MMAAAFPAMAEPVLRTGERAGAVIARKAGEEVRFIDVSDWRSVDLKQDLLSGDILRTNAAGQLAIVFSDRTQIRLGRNSTLVVKQITTGTSADTVLQLQSGTIWARAERGGSGVEVQTAAAAAAIRGTDWTMTVNGPNTALTVLEGVVQLSNPQGSIEVRQGEGAAATIGQAPRKVVVVDSDDREQMLFYLPPREAFQRMAPAAQPLAAIRRDADRILSIPPDRRSSEDLLALAEAQMSLESSGRASETLALINRARLSAGQQARVTLIEAVLAAGENRFSDAAGLFEQAERKLDGARRAIALWGGYYARSLSDPSRVEALPPSSGGPEAAFLRAYALGFLKDLNASIDALREAETRFPTDASLPAYRGWIALLLNDRDQALEAINRSLSLDPSEPTALEARSHFRAGFQGDTQGAMEDLQAVLKVTPGSSSTWNAIGDLQSTQGAAREAEAALKKAIELDPQSPVPHANLAIFYLDTNRISEAKREIDAALIADPALDQVLIARGRYYLQIGETDKAIDDLLAGTTANPADAQGQIVLSAAYYQKGDRIAAEQAIDNADRLDDNDPVIAALRTSVAIEEYDSHRAILQAREYLRRARARGGEYSSLGADQQAGSTLNSAFRFQGLNAWGEYYSDAVFDPFSGAAYIDEGIRGSSAPFANSYFYGADIVNNGPNANIFSSTLQGLLLEPTLISAPSRGFNILQRPFLEVAIGGGVTSGDGEAGYTLEAEVQGYFNLPMPTSYYANIEWQKMPESRPTEAVSSLDTELEALGGNAFVAASPTFYDHVVLYYNDSKSNFDSSVTTSEFPLLFGIPVAGTFPLDREREVSGTARNGGIGWSHTFGDQNVLNTALLYSGVESDDTQYLEFDDGTSLPVLRTRGEFRREAYIAGVSHAIGVNNLTWRYGIEGGWLDDRQRQSAENLLPPFLGGGTVTIDSSSERTAVGRAYVDLLHEITPELKAEYALFGSYVDREDDRRARLEPRAGIAWTPAEGQWLRASFMRSSIDMSTPTLSPVAVVGLQPNRFEVGSGGYADTYALRWDSEWSDILFTALEFQHQELKDPQIAVPLVAVPFSTPKGRIDRASLTANLLLEHGFGLYSSIAYTESKDEGRGTSTAGGALPYLPEWAGQLAVTWVSEANIRATLAANYIGSRDSQRGVTLDDYWTLDANLTWEPFDKRFEVELEARNLLDRDFDVDVATPGWGRSFKGTVKVRF
nr:FecR domain-containing protein [Rhizobium sp. NFR07]